MAGITAPSALACGSEAERCGLTKLAERGRRTVRSPSFPTGVLTIQEFDGVFMNSTTSWFPRLQPHHLIGSRCQAPCRKADHAGLRGGETPGLPGIVHATSNPSGLHSSTKGRQVASAPHPFLGLGPFLVSHTRRWSRLDQGMRMPSRSSDALEKTVSSFFHARLCSPDYQIGLVNWTAAGPHDVWRRLPAMQRSNWFGS